MRNLPVWRMGTRDLFVLIFVGTWLGTMFAGCTERAAANMVRACSGMMVVHQEGGEP